MGVHCARSGQLQAIIRAASLTEDGKFKLSVLDGENGLSNAEKFAVTDSGPAAKHHHHDDAVATALDDIGVGRSRLEFEVIVSRFSFIPARLDRKREVDAIRKAVDYLNLRPDGATLSLK